MLARFYPYWLWAVLALPSLAMISPFFGEDARVFHRLLHPTGECAARFMIISMMDTPLMHRKRCVYPVVLV